MFVSRLFFRIPSRYNRLTISSIRSLSSNGKQIVKQQVNLRPITPRTIATASTTLVGLGIARSYLAQSPKLVKCSEQDGKSLSGSSKGSAGFLGNLPAEISVSALAGAAAGFYLKRVSEEIAFYIGFGVIVVQGLAYFGYVQVNWKRLEEDFKKQMDANGDGKITPEDFKILSGAIMKKMTAHMASGASFTAGFWLGIKYL